MRNLKSHAESPPLASSERAAALVADAFSDAGWKVHREPVAGDNLRPDLIVKRGSMSYAVEIKAAPEGRGDRLIALWSQACLQAGYAARASSRPSKRVHPLAVVAAPRVSGRVIKQLLDFALVVAPEMAVGIVDHAGLRVFRGRHLDGLDAEGSGSLVARPASPIEQGKLFSDANQWMLKVLVAPELPEHHLAGPRGRYRNASELARAAGVSVMSGSRFVRQFMLEGFLENSHGHLALVRRPELFRRWQSAVAMAAPREIPVRALLNGSAEREMQRLMAHGRACLALFAAADALRLGFVRGVAPHVYVEHLDDMISAASKYVEAVGPAEMPDFILREADAPRSIFNGAVIARSGRVGTQVCDVIQAWLDTASHPARGQEQAEQIQNRALADLISGAANA